MIFIDASFYLSLLNANDFNHNKAVSQADKFRSEDYMTSQAVLGELLTVGSMRYDKELTIEFVEAILQSNTRVVLEKYNLIKRAFSIFKSIKSKNISWVDCFSFAIIEKFKIQKILTFDKDFKRYFFSK